MSSEATPKPRRPQNGKQGKGGKGGTPKSGGGGKHQSLTPQQHDSLREVRNVIKDQVSFRTDPAPSNGIVVVRTGNGRNDPFNAGGP